MYRLLSTFTNYIFILFESLYLGLLKSTLSSCEWMDGKVDEVKSDTGDTWQGKITLTCNGRGLAGVKSTFLNNNRTYSSYCCDVSFPS